MRAKSRAQIVAAGGLTVLLALTACSAASGEGANASSQKNTAITADTTDISEGVKPDEEAIALLPESVKEKGTLTVAMDLHYPPTTFLAEDNATPIGLNPDIARLIAKKLDLDLKFENTGFDTIIPGIDGGRYDFTVTTMSPTPERLEVLDMVNYLSVGVSVAVSHGNPLDISNDDMCGRNIAVTKGSNAQLVHLPNISEWTCESKGKPAINGVTLPNVQEALTQLVSKRVDGVFYDTPALVWAATQQPNTFTVLEPQVDTRTTHTQAVGLKKGSELTPAVLAAVQSILDSPEYEESLEKWGLTAAAIDTASLN